MQCRAGDLLSEINKTSVLGTLTTGKVILYRLSRHFYSSAVGPRELWVWLRNFEASKLQTLLHGICLPNLT